MLSSIYTLLAITTVQVYSKIRNSEPIFVNDFHSDPVKSLDSQIPPSLVGMIQVPKTVIPGQPLDPSDFMRGEQLQVATDILNVPDATDPIMAANQFQGDIVLPNRDVLVSLNSNSVSHNPPPKNAVIEEESKWPNGVIPYAISSAYDTNERAVIAKAMSAFHDSTCIRFVPRNDEKDYIFITKGSGCSSAVGRVGGQQTVTLGRGCIYFGIVIHELMHATGFWHEQSRADRDNFITIIWNNIQKGMEYNFQKYDWNIIQNLGVTYDTGSIMHYGSNSFAVDRKKPTIVANNGDEIGQRTHLSPKDIQKLKALYLCDSGNNVVTTVSPVTPENGCIDSNEFCSYWSSNGECDKNPAWMHNNCKKSCNKCNEECKNDNLNCDSWAKEGHCIKAAGYMIKHCRLACKTCQGSGIANGNCSDENEHCASWSSSGECRSNPSYMHKYCKKSCKKC
ncbi:UNVERIFIED_CONTAM: hypothetical protein RMT77_016313 [Armadillidium vulgare]